MPCPFPGMDPYLEDAGCWPLFQHHLIGTLHQTLLPAIGDRYRARLGQRSYVTEQALFTSVIREEHREEYLEIRQRSDNRLVSLIEVPSPANKTTPQGRAAYLEKRRDGRSSGANLIEIDLLLQGQPLLDYPRNTLPDRDHVVTVTRATQPDRYEIYTATVRKRLPRFKLPLASDDRDTVVDLQTVFTRCYDLGPFAERVDYRRDPAVPLADDDRRWLNDLLRQQKLR